MIIHFVFYTQWMTEPTKKVKNTVHAEDNFGKVFFLKFERDYLHWVGKDKAKSKTKAFKNPDNLLNISTRQNSPSSGQLVQRFAHCICKADGSLKRKISLFEKSWLYVQNKMFKSMKKRNHTKIKNSERNTHLAWKSQWACMDSSDSIPCTLDRNYLGKKPEDSKVCAWNH